jgi:hypothetical protein
MSPRLSTVALVLVTELANGLLVRDKALVALFLCNGRGVTSVSR